MARWTDNGTRLNLGELGELVVVEGYQSHKWWWQLETEDAIHTDSGTRFFDTAARARSAAEAWLRRALKQAGKRLEG